ncbi:uncharacterized protein E5676_scaffold416G00480 [Cucumis melo var. makuwa]|uniref:Uncharacterized protein n=1 Tax=Cucumis melo var. makuwa TaxID=1194695 RepID=A0A5D3D7K9_CUCMM|nr:uncharacterized protein E6C27_scaffold233G00100 [Cucumis melo var. makuwa]TYK19551.1 uncharacterized protein E5676_scaffold416G00480 [Cucumis melo var. makuwa]
MAPQNNDIQKNKKVESTRQDEQHGEASDQATSSNPISSSPFPEQMPYSMKFLKDILGKKRWMNDYEIVDLTQATSDVFKNRVLEKMTDPRSFTICTPKASKNKPSVEEPPELELKSLSNHLKYAYLGENDTLSIIISAN